MCLTEGLFSIIFTGILNTNIKNLVFNSTCNSCFSSGANNCGGRCLSSTVERTCLSVQPLSCLVRLQMSNLLSLAFEVLAFSFFILLFSLPECKHRRVEKVQIKIEECEYTQLSKNDMPDLLQKRLIIEYS